MTCRNWAKVLISLTIKIPRYQSCFVWIAIFDDKRSCCYHEGGLLIEQAGG